MATTTEHIERVPQYGVRVRMAKDLQARLRELANEQGVSMNALISQLLAGAVGWKPRLHEEAPAPGSEAGGTTAKEQESDAAEAD
jgi:hypothetical protein